MCPIFQRLSRWLGTHSTQHSRSRSKPRIRPSFVILEDRCLPSILGPGNMLSDQVNPTDAITPALQGDQPIQVSNSSAAAVPGSAPLDGMFLPSGGAAVLTRPELISDRAVAPTGLPTEFGGRLGPMVVEPQDTAAAWRGHFVSDDAQLTDLSPPDGLRMGGQSEISVSRAGASQVFVFAFSEGIPALSLSSPPGDRCQTTTVQSVSDGGLALVAALVTGNDEVALDSGGKLGFAVGLGESGVTNPNVPTLHATRTGTGGSGVSLTVHAGEPPAPNVALNAFISSIDDAVRQFQQEIAGAEAATAEAGAAAPADWETQIAVAVLVGGLWVELDRPENGKRATMAFYQEGDLAKSDLSRYLARYSDPDRVLQFTESNPGHKAPAAGCVGGCCGGRCR